MVINYKTPDSSNIYILNKNNVITINIDLLNLRNFVKEEIYKICCDPSNNYESGVEEKIVLEDNNFAFVNKKKKIITFTKKKYNIKEIKIQGYITKVEEIDGNFIIYDKTSKSLEIYYLNGNSFDKVANHKDVDLIFFFTFPKINSVLFCMNYTFNKISFNKKLYWYSEYFNTYLENPSISTFILPNLEDYLLEIRDKYTNSIFSYNDEESESKNLINEIALDFEKSRLSEEDFGDSTSREISSIIYRKCEYCEKDIDIKKLFEYKRKSTKNSIRNKDKDKDNPNKICECKNEFCQSLYCCEEHRDLDYKQFHFFHCKLRHFFLNYEYSNQITFFNDLIILISDIIKYIFSNIFDKDDYLFYLPFIKIITFLLKNLNMKYISDMVVEYSQKKHQTKNELTSLLFYQELIFYYYNIILLSLNFGIRANLLDFVKKEIDFLSEDEEQFFNKSTLSSTIFNRNIHFYQEYIDFTKSDFFFCR